MLWTRPFLLSLLLCLGACGDGGESTDYSPSYRTLPPERAGEYVFGAYPLHNPERLLTVYGPLVDYLTRHLDGAALVLQGSPSYAEFDRQLRERRFDFALANPYQIIQSLGRGYRVFGEIDEGDRFRGVILVRRNGPVHRLADLKGQAVSFPAPTAMAGAMMPQYYLAAHGIAPHRDIDICYVGSQESSIMNVYLGLTAAAAVGLAPWESFQRRSPEKAATLQARWQTPPLPGPGLLARDDLPPEVVRRVGDILFHLQDDVEGRAILEELSPGRFRPADADTYGPVRAFLHDFARTVHPLEND